MYKQLMYGDDPGNDKHDNSDSDIPISRPMSKHNTPAPYDNSSEHGVLNDKIAQRRQELGIFEKSKSAKRFFLSSDSDSEVGLQLGAKAKPKAAKNSGNAPTKRRATRAKQILLRMPS